MALLASLSIHLSAPQAGNVKGAVCIFLAAKLQTFYNANRVKMRNIRRRFGSSPYRVPKKNDGEMGSSLGEALHVTPSIELCNSNPFRISSIVLEPH